MSVCVRACVRACVRVCVLRVAVWMSLKNVGVEVGMKAEPLRNRGSLMACLETSGAAR